jgi:DNA primase large subunit
MRGSGKKYWPPKCTTVAEAGLCPLSEEERGRCKWLNRLIGLIKKNQD